MTESEMTQKRMIDLSRMSYERGIYTYSDFLTLAEQSDFADITMTDKLFSRDYQCFGGCNGAERIMVRFGSEEALGYQESWPIACIAIKPLNRKFAEELSHRDILGSLMNLGIERHLLGDIIVKPDSSYVFVQEHIADTLCHELTRVRHTSVMANVIDNPNEDVSPSLAPLNLQVKSERVDLIISHTYNLSRSQTAELFSAKEIFVNGRLMENESHTLKSNDIVSVRGHGRFIYGGTTGTTKKGNLVIQISKYI